MSPTATIDDLTIKLSQTAGWLESPSEAAAHLESLGVTDADARAHYGVADVFALATEVARRQREAEPAIEHAWEEERLRQQSEWDKHKPPSLLQSVLRFFFRGVAFGLPMAIMIFAILALLYSLWAYYYFTVTRATAIGVGTALSYLLAGGFMQAIGRRGLMYLRQGMYMLSLKVSALFVISGMVMAGLVSLGVFAFFSLVPVVSAKERGIAVLYFLTLSVLWLCLAVLYMLQRNFLFTFSIALGIGIVYVLREYYAWNIVAAHQVGILGAAAFSIGVSMILLLVKHHRSKDPRLPLATKLPRITMLLASVGPFFLFGLMYFGLIFTDRVMAWTGRMPFRQTFIWFRTDYEVGENWALLGLLPALGALEYALYRFSGFVKARQIEYTLEETGSFRAWFLRFFRRQLVFFIIMSVIGVIVAYIGVRHLRGSLPEVGILLNRTSVFVFVFASIGYILCAFGLLNTSLFFWLSRPRLAILAILPAMGVNFIVGFLLSRMISYQWAIVGFTCGAGVFAAISFLLALRVLSRLDYYFYAAV